MSPVDRVRKLALLAALAAIAISGLSIPAAAHETEAMLYLVEFEANPAGTPTSREQAIELLEQLIIPSLQGLDQQMKDKKIVAGGILVGARAGVMMVRARSHDEVTRMVRKIPAWGVWDWKITALEGMAHRANLETEMVSELRAMSQR